VWKTLHMLVYVAYALLVAHVDSGLLQSETSPLLAAALASGYSLSSRSMWPLRDGKQSGLEDAGPAAEGLVNACALTEIPEKWRHSCLSQWGACRDFQVRRKNISNSNVCSTKNGPLGEAKSSMVCDMPWHGYQYLPEDGTSPRPSLKRSARFKQGSLTARVDRPQTETAALGSSPR